MRLYIVTDDLGSFPMLWDDPVPPRSSARLHLNWQLVADVETVEQAYEVLDRLGIGATGSAIPAPKPDRR